MNNYNNNHNHNRKKKRLTEQCDVVLQVERLRTGDPGQPEPAAAVEPRRRAQHDHPGQDDVPL